jgi:hypothetical protein
MMSPNGQRTYQVVYPGPVRTEVLRLRERATLLGLRDSYLLDLKHLHHNLTMAPQGFGEVAYRLPHSGMPVYRGVVGMLLAYFAVQEFERVVFVKSVAPVPAHRLGQTD